MLFFLETPTRHDSVNDEGNWRKLIKKTINEKNSTNQWLFLNIKTWNVYLITTLRYRRQVLIWPHRFGNHFNRLTRFSFRHYEREVDCRLAVAETHCCTIRNTYITGHSIRLVFNMKFFRGALRVLNADVFPLMKKQKEKSFISTIELHPCSLGGVGDCLNFDQ